MPHPDNFSEPDAEYEYYHGASLAALNHLAEEKGYALLGCDSKGVNAFFIRKDLLDKTGLISLSVADAWRPHYWRTAAHTLAEQQSRFKGAPLVEIG